MQKIINSLEESAQVLKQAKVLLRPYRALSGRYLLANLKMILVIAKSDLNLQAKTPALLQIKMVNKEAVVVVVVDKIY